MRALAFFAVALLIGCGGAQRVQSTPDAEGRYAIVMEHHLRAGFLFEESATFRSRTTQTVMVENQRGEPATEEESMAFSGRGEVVSVRDDGQPAILRYTVTSLERVVNGSATVLARPGAVLEIHVGHTAETASATLDGVPVDEATLHVMGNVLELSSSGDGDDLFASDAPRAPGESWSPDLAAISRGLSQGGIVIIDPARSNARMTLVAHEERDGWPGLSVEGTLASGGIEVPMPEGASTREASMSVRFAGFFPDDTSIPTLFDQMNMEMHVVIDLATPAGPSAVISMDVASVHQRSLRPL